MSIPNDENNYVPRALNLTGLYRAPPNIVVALTDVTMGIERARFTAIMAAAGDLTLLRRRRMGFVFESLNLTLTGLVLGLFYGSVRPTRRALLLSPVDALAIE